MGIISITSAVVVDARLNDDFRKTAVIERNFFSPILENLINIGAVLLWPNVYFVVIFGTIVSLMGFFGAYSNIILALLGAKTYDVKLKNGDKFVLYSTETIKSGNDIKTNHLAVITDRMVIKSIPIYGNIAPWEDEDDNEEAEEN